MKLSNVLFALVSGSVVFVACAAEQASTTLLLRLSLTSRQVLDELLVVGGEARREGPNLGPELRMGGGLLHPSQLDGRSGPHELGHELHEHPDGPDEGDTARHREANGDREGAFGNRCGGSESSCARAGQRGGLGVGH